MRIRIQEIKWIWIHADPNPHHWYYLGQYTLRTCIQYLSSLQNYFTRIYLTFRQDSIVIMKKKPGNNVSALTCMPGENPGPAGGGGGGCAGDWKYYFKIEKQCCGSGSVQIHINLIRIRYFHVVMKRGILVFLSVGMVPGCQYILDFVQSLLNASEDLGAELDNQTIINLRCKL